MKFRVVLFILAFSMALFAQLADVEVTIEVDNLKPQEKSDLEFLNGQIKDYLQGHEYIDNKYNIALPVRISIFVQSSSLSGTERSFSGQMIAVTESNDLQLFEKNLKFNYSQSEALIHSPDIKSLPTILDFYALVLLGAEMDTYEPLGGTSIFEEARSLGTRAQMSNYSSGWTERLTSLDELTELRYFRQFKYYFWTIVDLEASENLKEIPEKIDKALYYLEEELKINNRNRFIHLFLDAHAQDLAELLRLYGNEKDKMRIIDLDPDNHETYENIFKN
ncbi:MAG: DUF4835 family protein [Candidatus Marinimicrobia bacterium]|nr:DUF4835 family protein [Candidatus Neomarinimicrobiota bacterium]